MTSRSDLAATETRAGARRAERGPGRGMTRTDAARACGALCPAPATVARLLREAYGRPRPPDSLGLLGCLVRTLLSQNTTDTNADAAYEALRRRFADWSEIAGARLPSLEATIRTAGLARQRSKALRAIVRRLREDDPSLELAFLRDLPTPALLEYLLALPGVGPKTAACVALFELRRPVFPVDTHILRISTRLGWIEPGKTTAAAQALLEPLIPADLRLEMHLNLIAHGRRTCPARRPRCGECVLVKLCPKVGAEGQ